jgi:hypothetical protein
MNTQTLSTPMLFACVLALVLTSVMSWGFVDSTRVARWVQAAPAMAIAAADLPARVVM